MVVSNVLLEEYRLSFNVQGKDERHYIETTHEEITAFIAGYWDLNVDDDSVLIALETDDLSLYIRQHVKDWKELPNVDAPIKFITLREDHRVKHKDIYIIKDVEQAVLECVEYIKNIDTPALDIEASSLVYQYANVLLLAIGSEDKQFVFDMTSVPFSCLAPIAALNKQWLGQNIKYDTSVLAWNGFEIKRCWDTLIAEQTLRRGSKAPNSLDKIIERRLGITHDVGKDIRQDFIGQTKAMIFGTDHIRYAATDIRHLPKIKEVQIEFAKRHKLIDWLEDYEFPLQIVISKTELEGVRLDKEKWRGLAEKNRLRIRAYEIDADKEVARLLEERGNKELLAGKYTRKRRVVDIVQTSLFGDDKITQNKAAGNISYGSDKQVKELFRTLGEEPPVIKDKKTGTFKDSVGKDALEEWLIEHPFHRLTKLIKILIQMADLRTKISSFGENYIKAINVKTGKLHTSYKTASTETGRFSSGDMKNGLINSQNIPKLKEYRQCFFTDEGYDIVTCDLSGAELIILASMAQDKKLIELALGDIHSYLATAAFRNLVPRYLQLGKGSAEENLRDLMDGLKADEKITLEEVAELVANPRGITISKTKFKWLRDKFKNVVYGIAYGASNVRIAKVLTIDKVSAQLVLDTIAAELPVTMKFLDNAAAFGLHHGYIEFNPRSHNRRWFEQVIDTAKAGMSLSFGVRGEVERACKNSPIQGTQSNMIKEAIVDIDEYIKIHNLDCVMLLCVHDELVYKFPKYLNEEVLPYNGHLYNFPDIVKLMMCKASNRYLKGVEMGAEYHVEPTWTK